MRRARVAVVTLLTVTVVGTAVVLHEGFSASAWVRALAISGAIAALAAIVAVPSLRVALTMPMVVVASLGLLAVAVVLPPAESRDLFSYAMDGRILQHYGVSPYTHAPAEFPHDPLLAQVGSGWRHTRSVYGPAFTAMSAGVAWIAGPDVLANRLGFQLLAALSVLAILVLLYRTTRDPVVVALVGCNPVVMLEVVNVGRNDALVGFALLAGVVLAGRRRLVAAAVLLAVAASVKLVAIAALGFVLIWAWRHHGARLAARAGAAGALVVVVPYVLAGGTRALTPLADASDRLSRASIGQFGRGGAVEHLLGIAEGEPAHAVVGRIGPAAIVVVIGLALLFACSRLADPTPELVAVGAIAAFLFAGSYVLASYAMWVLPIAAWRHRAGVSRAVLVWSALLTIAYQAVRPLPSTPLDLAVWLTSAFTLLFALTAILLLTVAAVRRMRPLAG